MEPLSHRGLPRLSWIDTLYSSTCARAGREAGWERAPSPARRPDGPGARGARLVWGARRGLWAAGTVSQVPSGLGGGKAAWGARDRPQIGSPERTSGRWVGAQRID